MKNLFLSLAFMLIGSFAFANNNENGDDKKKKETPKTEVVNQVSVNSNQIETEDEAIHCKVTIGDVSMSCWFCNCKDLQDAALIAAGY